MKVSSEMRMTDDDHEYQENDYDIFPLGMCSHDVLCIVC